MLGAGLLVGAAAGEVSVLLFPLVSMKKPSTSENLVAASARKEPPFKEAEVASGEAAVAEEGAPIAFVDAEVAEREADDTVEDEVSAATFDVEETHEVEAAVPTN